MGIARGNVPFGPISLLLVFVSLNLTQSSTTFRKTFLDLIKMEVFLEGRPMRPGPWKQPLPSAASVPRSLAPSQDSILQSGRKSFVLCNHSPCWGNHSPFLSFCPTDRGEEMGWPCGSRSCLDRQPSKDLTE